MASLSSPSCSSPSYLPYGSSSSISQFSSATPATFPLHHPTNTKHFKSLKTTKNLRFFSPKTTATTDDKSPISTSTSLVQEDNKPNKEVEECVRVLKNAAKTRKVAPMEILSAFSVIEKAKMDPSGFFETLGGTESPGRTWMLVFTAEKGLKGGKYFPITAVQRFDAAGKRIENGVYLGPLGSLTFEGRLSWKQRILAFIFERVRIKVGPLDPFEISFGGKDDREPSNKDPFFIWFYIDEEIAVARGKSGGTAFWVRCQRLST